MKILSVCPNSARLSTFPSPYPNDPVLTNKALNELKSGELVQIKTMARTVYLKVLDSISGDSPCQSVSESVVYPNKKMLEAYGPNSTT
jgi:hypothetical protein